MKEFHVYLYGPDRGPLGISFEDAQHELEGISGLHFEPDGSFAWTPPSDRDGGRHPQVFGMLYDAANQLQYVELRGGCRIDHWRRLTRILLARLPAEATVLELPAQRLQELQHFEAANFN